EKIIRQGLMKRCFAFHRLRHITLKSLDKIKVAGLHPASGPASGKHVSSFLDCKPTSTDLA
ncbi:hypothetical protein, partial [Natronohydrobacter thiooxidans]|uniref:hypothetical protein n=1 Tax=Natronohydrobacter thiooxidans TaxID=87172 RepID=UPI001C3131B7